MLLQLVSSSSSSLSPTRPPPWRPCSAAAAVRCAASSSTPWAVTAAAGQQVAKVHSYGTMHYERRTPPRWGTLYQRIAVGHGGQPVGRTLRAWDEGERRLEKRELCCIAKELRKFRRFNLALQVYEWMTERRYRFSLTSGDMAIQLDLIAKVHGVSHAEIFFEDLPDALKDKRTYGSLLNVYAQAILKEKTKDTFEQMRQKGFAYHTLTCNVLMNFYVDAGEPDEVPAIIEEMKARNVAFDVCTYNIWIKSCAAKQDADGMEQVFNQMIADESVAANWKTYTTLASAYIKLGNSGKAEECLKDAEKRITGQETKCFHYLITLYSHLGKKEEVYRVWNWYKATFPTIHNQGYQEVLSALVRIGDIEGAEFLYEEWASKSASFDPKTMSILLAWYAKEGFATKAEQTLNQFVEKGGNPKPNTGEILATAYHDMPLHLVSSSSLSPTRPPPWRPCSAAAAAVRCAASSSTPSAATAATGQLVAKVHSYRTVGYERRMPPRWGTIYQRITHGMRPVGRTLGACDEGERRLEKWELCRLAKELRKSQRFNLALQVYEWMTERGDRFSLTSIDMAIQLDLIARVQGVSHAEKYFEDLPDALKDKRTYGSLLNVYAQAMLKEKTEDTFEQMRQKGFAYSTLPCNMLMNFYVNAGEPDEVSAIIEEMKERNVAFDVCTYDIWIKSCAAKQDTDGMEQVFNQMIADESVVADWRTYTTLASMYIKLGNSVKAEECLKEAEKRRTGRDKMFFYSLIELYSHLGKKEEVYRVWNWYKATFARIHNQGYKVVLSALVRIGDIEGAELLYEEWASKKTSLDPKTVNVLLAWYAKEGFTTKAEHTLNQFVEKGGNPKSFTWEILAMAYLKHNKVSEALSSMEKAAAVYSASKWRWRPRPANVESLLASFKEKNDRKSRDRLMSVLTSIGCAENEEYKSLINAYAFAGT